MRRKGKIVGRPKLDPEEKRKEEKLLGRGIGGRNTPKVPKRRIVIKEANYD